TLSSPCLCFILIFLFTDTPPTEIYTLSLHDALPISDRSAPLRAIVQLHQPVGYTGCGKVSVRTAWKSATRIALRIDLIRSRCTRDRKSTRLNSSHVKISYAVFCLKKKNKKSYHIDLD